MENCGQIGFAEYASPGSQELGTTISDVFARGINTVILENHGVVSGAADLMSAYEQMETLEYTARTLIYSKSLGEVKWLQAGAVLDAWMHPVFSGELSEFALQPDGVSEARTHLAEIVRRAYRQHLMFSTSGSASTRLSADSFLVTPYGTDRNWLEPEDLVIIQNQSRQSNNPPTRLLELHRAIYHQHKNVGAVMTSQAPYLTAFAVTEQRLTPALFQKVICCCDIFHWCHWQMPYNNPRGCWSFGNQSPALR